MSLFTNPDGIPNVKAAELVVQKVNSHVMSSSATKTALTLSGDHPNFFRTIANNDAQAELQVMYATKNLKTRKVAILHDRGDYGKGQAELVEKHFEKAGVEVVFFEGVIPMMSQKIHCLLTPKKNIIKNAKFVEMGAKQ